MNKYQEALVDIRCDIYNFIDNNYDEAFKMVYNKQFKLLQELVDQTKTPTLEEVKKEWEELGYEWVENEIYINIIKKYEGIDFDVILSIDKRTRNYCCFEDDGCDNRSLNITYREHQLLTKTFRALGWEV